MHPSKIYFNIIFLSLKSFDWNFICTSHFLYSQIYSIGSIIYMISDVWKNTFRYVVVLRFRMYRFLAIPSRLKYTQVILITMRSDGSEYRRLKYKSKLDSALCYTLCCEDTWGNSTTIPSTLLDTGCILSGSCFDYFFLGGRAHRVNIWSRILRVIKKKWNVRCTISYWTVSGQAL